VELKLEPPDRSEHAAQLAPEQHASLLRGPSVVTSLTILHAGCSPFERSTPTLRGGAQRTACLSVVSAAGTRAANRTDPGKRGAVGPPTLRCVRLDQQGGGLGEKGAGTSSEGARLLGRPTHVPGNIYGRDLFVKLFDIMS
jgi:hypothetical protein